MTQRSSIIVLLLAAAIFSLFVSVVLLGHDLFSKINILAVFVSEAIAFTFMALNYGLILHPSRSAKVVLIVMYIVVGWWWQNMITTPTADLVYSVRALNALAWSALIGWLAGLIHLATLHNLPKEEVQK